MQCHENFFARSIAMWWDVPVPPLPRARDLSIALAAVAIGALLAWVALA
jgi:hypothetical protein